MPEPFAESVDDDAGHPWRDWRELRHESRVRNLLFHLLVTSEFYEPLDRYVPDIEFTSIAAAVLPSNWRLARRGIWFEAKPLVGAALPIQGWKIHLSSSATGAKTVLGRALPICVALDAPFKFLCDARLLEIMNDKSAERGSAGKFVTIYPRNEAHFRSLLNELAASLDGLDGPLILSDRRIRGSQVVHYRYGGITALGRLDEQGAVIPVLVGLDGQAILDERLPYFWLPPGVVDSVNGAADDDAEPGDVTLGGGRYSVTEAITYSNAGGVYEAVDTRSGTRVIIKEARPNTASAEDGTDAVALREKEWGLLRQLQGRGVAPAPIELFRDWEHLFLVEERIEGITAGRLAVTTSALYAATATESDLSSYFSVVRHLGDDLARVIGVIHDAGIVYGDLSPSNIVVTPELRTFLVDFEVAVRRGSSQGRRFFTPGFSKWSRLRTSMAPEDDYYALGCVLLWMLAPVNALLDLKPNAAREFLEDLERDYGLPGTLTSTILALLDMDPTQRPGLDRVRAVLSAPVSDARLPAAVTNLDQRRVRGVISEAIRFVDGSATPDRRDQFFPVTPNSPNAMNVAYGALGIARSRVLLGHATGPVLREWLVSHECTEENYPPGLYVGLAGLAWAYADLGDADRAHAMLKRAYDHDLLFAAADVYSGAAGVGLACLELWQRTGDATQLDRAVQIGEVLLAEGRDDERGRFWPSPTGTIPLGYARGASGIALFLLYLSLASGDRRYREHGRGALDFDLSYAVTRSGGMTLPEDTEALEIVFPYWFRGSAGLGTAVVRYLAAGDIDLHDRVRAIAADCNRKFTIMPGLFFGLAGLGNLLLDCHQLLGGTLYLEQARRVAEGILLFAIERPTGIAFPGEDLYRISADLGSGICGIALFLQRLTNGSANFNFLPDGLLPRSRSTDAAPIRGT